MSVVKVRTNRQVTIPKAIFDQTGLAEGDFVEVSRRDNQIVITPKQLVDADDRLAEDEEEQIRKGEKDLTEGRSARWDRVKEQLGL